MKKLLLALLMATATPAMAQVSPSVEVAASGRSTKDVTPGLFVGLEAPISDVARLGAQLGLERNDGENTFSVGVVPSIKLFGATSLYGNVAGIMTNDNLGYRLGAGLKQGLTDRTYIKAGVRYDSIGATEGTVALGLRF